MERIDWYEKASAYKEAYAEVLNGLVSIPSVYDASTKTDRQPFGEKIDEALLYMLQTGSKDGF